MKLPIAPPDEAAIARRISDGDRLGAIIDLGMASARSSSEYLSWDKLRHLTPPGDLSHEEWWFVEKLARRSMRRQVDTLRDVDGRPFSYCLPDEILAAVEQINSQASGNITVSEQVTNPSTRDRFIVSSLVEEAITSSQLEGASTSRRDAKEMIRSGRPPRDRSERMILNNYNAMRRIGELRHEEFTPELVCEIHRIVTDGTLDNPEGAGRLQSDDSLRVAVWSDEGQLLHRPPPVEQLPDRLIALCDFANDSDSAFGGYMPATLRAISVHFMVGYDHYFEDGNGRTARALFYWSMLRSGYWLTEFLAISRILRKAPAQYVRSFVLTEQDDGDLTYFFIYQLTVLQRAIRELHEYLARKAAELRALQSVLKSRPGEFNHRQMALLEHATRNADATYSVQSHSSSHLVTGETARHDLAGLESKGLLVRTKVGRRFVWVPAADLADLLGVR